MVLTATLEFNNILTTTFSYLRQIVKCILIYLENIKFNIFNNVLQVHDVLIY